MFLTYIFDVFKNILSGAKITLLVFALTLLSSIPFGMLGTILKRVNFRPFKFLKGNKFFNLLSRFNPLRFILDIYTWVIRGTPLLLQLFFVLYGLPIIFKIQVDRFYGALITFIVNYTAYFIEIFRGGMESISKGQFEACKVLSFNKTQTYLYVILPQTFKKTIPSITNEAINLIKDTALMASIALADILMIAKEEVNHTFRFEAYFVAAIVYLVLTYIIVFVFKKIEKKHAFYN